MKLTVRLISNDSRVTLAATLITAGEGAARSFAGARSAAGVHLFLDGDRDFHVVLDAAPSAAERALLELLRGGRVTLRFKGARSTLRRRLAAITGAGEAPTVSVEEAPAAASAGALALTSAMHGAAALFLLPSGAMAGSAEGPAPRGMDALEVIVTAARWVSSRRTSSFERLFPPSAFHPDAPIREERLSAAQAAVLVDQLAAIVAAAAVGPEAGVDAAQLRSACLTVLAHVIATAARDAELRAAADQAFAIITGMIAAEHGEHAWPELRAHAISLLSQRGPALSPAQQAAVQELLRGMVRGSPPYEALPEIWRFALCAAHDFVRGSVAVLVSQHGFKEVEAPSDAPAPPGAFGRAYTVVEAPFVGPKGERIQVFARSASPRNENWEMGEEYFVGLMINRHANLGAADMTAALLEVEQRGYKLMFNAQCAGLTTRFAISRIFPDADIYSSWDSTYFRTGPDGELSASEGVDCLVAVLRGMSAGESFAAIDPRIRKAQWYHPQNRDKEFVQFIGPANPLVTRRYEDVNRDGKADFYDGFLDLRLVEIAEQIHRSATPQDPGAAGSQIAGAAATGLGWAVGSLNRVTQYSELWDEMPGQSAIFYAFRSGGFFSAAEPPQDIARGSGPVIDVSTAPALVRYLPEGRSISAEVLFHAWLSHSAQELKRLLCAAAAYWQAIDLGHLGGRAPLDTPLGRRGGLLILLAGLLEFPADQNMIDGLWEMALAMLGLPKISRSLVRRCINDADHKAGNYYGSRRGVIELIGDGVAPGRLQAGDPLAFELLGAEDPMVGRARPLTLAP
jgi:hypothetical protein